MVCTVVGLAMSVFTAFVAKIAESVIGAILQGREGLKWMTSEVVNFLNTLIGAMVRDVIGRAGHFARICWRESEDPKLDTASLIRALTQNLRQRRRIHKNTDLHIFQLRKPSGDRPSPRRRITPFRLREEIPCRFSHQRLSLSHGDSNLQL
jgi:hypothetical protein